MNAELKAVMRKLPRAFKRMARELERIMVKLGRTYVELGRAMAPPLSKGLNSGYRSFEDQKALWESYGQGLWQINARRHLPNARASWHMRHVAVIYGSRVPVSARFRMPVGDVLPIGMQKQAWRGYR